MSADNSPSRSDILPESLLRTARLAHYKESASCAAYLGILRRPSKRGIRLVHACAIVSHCHSLAYRDSLGRRASRLLWKAYTGLSSCLLSPISAREALLLFWHPLEPFCK